MAYTLKRVTNDGEEILYGFVDTDKPVSNSTSNTPPTEDDTYNVVAGCYVLETISTAALPMYSRPELWSWNVGDLAEGYAVDQKTFGVAASLCGIPDCFDDCRAAGVFEGGVWSSTSKCDNYELLLKECVCKNDRIAMVQHMRDAGCAVPAPYVVNDAFGEPVKQVTISVTSHPTYTTTISLLMKDTEVPERNVPRAFKTQLEGRCMATFLGVYPWSKVQLTEINCKSASSLIGTRRLREQLTDAIRGSAAERRLPSIRSLTRLTLTVDASESDDSANDQAYRFESLENKPINDFSSLKSQLQANVDLLADPAELMSVEAYSETRDVIDDVVFDVLFLGPTPEPTKAPTPAPAVGETVAPSPESPTLIEKPQSSTSAGNGSGGGSSEIGMYAGLAVAGLVAMGMLYCCIGGAARNRQNSKTKKEKAAAQRVADDEAFRSMQAANAAKLAAANGPVSAVPLD
ncbi:unnamed protein product [Phaeothamnion confervicola]